MVIYYHMYNLELVTLLEKVLMKSYQIKNGEHAFHCPFCPFHFQRRRILHFNIFQRVFDRKNRLRDSRERTIETFIVGQPAAPTGEPSTAAALARDSGCGTALSSQIHNSRDQMCQLFFCENVKSN